MDHVKMLEGENFFKNFIPDKFVTNNDQNYFRNIQVKKKNWRNLSDNEIQKLKINGNIAQNWNDIFVTENFDPNLVRNSNFYGMVRIGDLKNIFLTQHDLKLAAGIYNSTIISSDIGDFCAVHNVRYLAYYIIHKRCILFNIDEMHATCHAKFGNGILKDGEDETLRIHIDVMNEAGGRYILPFDGIVPADAYMWGKYRDDSELMKRFTEITQNSFDSSRGYYGEIGEQSVIKNTRIIKDTKTGPCAYIKGANKLKNLTVNSSLEEKTQIGEGVEIVNGIIGYGCHIFYGCKAVRFIMGNNSSLKYGARLIHSFLGDNSTISCCEILNNLIFNSHEQHHNNSFLIASVVMGQSNIAAGATIGSNHNSRSNDNELVAGRGFWPGLCVTIKHSSKFASYNLLAKGNYPYELNIPFPFTLINNSEHDNVLHLMPGYWWLYNMYALIRNSWKLKKRDLRKRKTQNIEFDMFAPDTIEEIFSAMRLLEIMTAKNYLKKQNESYEKTDEDALAKKGKEIFAQSISLTENIEIENELIERSSRKCLLLKVDKGYSAYRQMIIYYSVKNILEYIIQNNIYDINSLNEISGSKIDKMWINLGGQIVSASNFDKMKNDIKKGKLKTWEDIHKRYDDLWKNYFNEKQIHAFVSLKRIYEITKLELPLLKNAIKEFIQIQKLICENVIKSRKKDYDNIFKESTFENPQEMKSVIGDIDDNSFIKIVKSESEEFIKKAEYVLSKLK